MARSALVDDARALLAVLAQRPRHAFTHGGRLLRAAQEQGDLEAAAVAGRVLGLAALHLGRVDTAVTYLESALLCATEVNSAELAAETRMTLAFALSRRGQMDAALDTVTVALSASAGVARARALAQRGAIFQQLERFDDAEADYRSALPVLRDAEDWPWVTRVHTNRGVLRIYRGRLAAAEADLAQAEYLATARELDLQRAFAVENLAFLHIRRGDVPAALSRLDEAERRLAALGARAATVLLDRSELLLSVGLLPEAREAAESALEDLTRTRRRSARPQAQLLLAEALLQAGQVRSARVVATRARATFVRQQRPEWVALARLLVLRCRLAAGERVLPSADGVLEVAGRLDAAGWSLQAFDTRLLAARLLLQHGDATGARTLLADSVAHPRVAPVALRVRAWHAEALLRLAEGRRPAALSALRTGVRLVEEHQATLGATDVRSSVSSSRAELVTLGLDLSLGAGRPRDVLLWAERGRATALLTRPARPPNDPELAERLGELRGVVAALEEARAAGRPLEALTRHQLQLERSVRDLARRSSQTGRTGVRAVHPSPDALAAALEDRALVEFVEHDGSFLAISVVDGQVRLDQVARADAVLPLLDHLQFALRRLTRTSAPAVSVTAAVELLGELGVRLDQALLAPLRRRLGDRPVVVVPTGRLQGLPWALLPTCAGRPVTVAPSAALWSLAAARPRRAGPVAAVAGPDLPAAVGEVGAVGRLYRGAGTLDGERASVDAVRAVLAGAGAVHVAAHCRLRTDNALFSSLRFADGPLTVYDLESLPGVPGLVVLAACDAARSVVQGGEELVGLAAAFLSLGTSTLVASMLPIVDSAAAGLMVALHAGISAGVPPAVALARVQSEALHEGGPAERAAAAALVCLGADRPLPLPTGSAAAAGRDARVPALR
jgi:tetratricopeptide (TPR) repeat protein